MRLRNPAVLPVATLVLAGLLVSPGEMRAKPWPPDSGITPGKTTREEAIKKLGEPSRTFSKGGKLSDGLNYQGEEAITGSVEANFYFNKHGILFRIDVFPAREISRAKVEEIYGKKYVERVTKSGNTFLNYWRDGMVVFLEKEGGNVASFMFTEPRAGSKGGSR
jgi:hypothetical protein